MGPRVDGQDTKSHESPLLFVIADDDAIREALGELLVEAGHRVETWARGRDALVRMDTGVLPDLIVLDLTKSPLDGRQFRTEQGRRPCLLEIPVVVIVRDATGKPATLDADAFLHEPLDSERVRTVIERLLVTRQRTRLEEHSREFERLRALGTLVAGVAHEINNPLTYVCGNLELALRECRKLAGDAGVKDAELKRIDAALTGARLGADRITHVVGALSRFSRSDEDEAEALDVHAAIEAAITLGSSTIRSRARLVRDYGDLPLVIGSESRLAQVFLNLLVNAAQAIPADGNDDHEIRIASGRADGIVFVEVSDTGVGIPPEIVKRVFEPFFTTKPPGEGTGLGLSISREIVSSLGGRLTARARPGRGTTFRVELPTIRSHLRDSSARLRAIGEETTPMVQKSLRIVVVDDEPLVGSVIAAALSEHDVSVHSNPREALARLAKDGDGVDVVLCDAYMRSLDGKSLFDALAQRRPELAHRVVFMTGSTDPEEIRRLETRSGKSILRKPFSISTLHRQIEEVVVAEPAASA